AHKARVASGGLSAYSAPMPKRRPPTMRVSTLSSRLALAGALALSASTGFAQDPNAFRLPTPSASPAPVRQGPVAPDVPESRQPPRPSPTPTPAPTAAAQPAPAPTPSPTSAPATAPSAPTARPTATPRAPAVAAPTTVAP